MRRQRGAQACAEAKLTSSVMLSAVLVQPKSYTYVSCLTCMSLAFSHSTQRAALPIAQNGTEQK